MFIFVGHLITAQQITNGGFLKFNLVFNQKPFELNNTYITSKKDSIEISTIRFYVSDIRFEYSDCSYINEIGYHLIDAANFASMEIQLKKTPIKKIKNITFSIGIDSLTNVSGAMAGDLDPTNGMYWAWQSGYINVKIEGKSSSCATRKNIFQFHLGGYLKPYNAIRKVTLEVTNEYTNSINIGIDLAKFVDSFYWTEFNSVMIPGEQAMHLSETFSKIFNLE